MSPFECARRLLDYSSRELSLGACIDLVFQDADLIPLLIHVRHPFALTESSTSLAVWVACGS